jgi:membrane protein required for colicin V production
MATFDILALLILCVLALYGLMKGIVRLVLGFVGLIAGWLLAVKYAEPLALRIGAGRFGDAARTAGPDLTRLAAFAIIFLGVALASGVAAWLIGRALGAVHLQWADRLAGAGVGLILGLILICALTVPLVALWPPDGGALMRDAVLAPYAAAGGEYLLALVPEPMHSRFKSALGRLRG